MIWRIEAILEAGEQGRGLLTTEPAFVLRRQKAKNR